MGLAGKRLRFSAPVALLVILLVLLGTFVIQAVGSLDQAKIAQPVEPWVPSVDYSRRPAEGSYPIELKLWPPAMAGKQPLRSLAIQFDNPNTVKGVLRLSIKNADGSSMEFPFSADEFHDNDYVTFPMNGKIPVSGELSSLGGGLVWTIEVSSPDSSPATCAIYELMDGTFLTAPGCS